MTNDGVSISTSGWEVLVYSISGGLMVLTGCISKQGVSLIVFAKLSALVLTVVDLLAKVNILLSLIWIYSPVFKVYRHYLIW